MIRDAAPAEAGRRHFGIGVRMFEDRNFAGAAVEFEASYQAHPTAAALQNLAVAQKALFRYADAADTLDKMLVEFGAAIPAEDRQAAEEALREMNALTARLLVVVDPPDAAVTIDGRIIAPGALRAPLRLSAGEHVVRATTSARSDERTVALAAGETDGRVTISLIAPGMPAGGSPTVLEPSAAPAADTPIAAPVARPEAPVAQLGLYGVATLAGYLAPGAAPSGMRSIDAGAEIGYGARVGYRASDLLAGELMFEEVATTESLGVCVTGTGSMMGQTDCATSSTFGHRLDTSRLGASGRVHAVAAGGQLFGALGVGVALHRQQFEAGAPTSVPGAYASSGRDPFGQLEAGYRLEVGHLVIEGAVVGVVESMSSIGYDKARPRGGLGVRLGYAGL